MSDSPIAQLEARLRANPDDRESWRVYADHLLDQGERRGELITLSALLAAQPRGNESLARTVARLDDELRGAWASELDAEQATFTWKHGFPVRLTYSIAAPRDFKRLARLLGDLRVRLCGHLDLRFDPMMRARFYEGVATLELGRIVALHTAYMRRGNALARALATNPSLQLDELVLADVHLGDPGLVALARSVALRGLIRLDLRRNAFGAKGLAALLDSPLVERLEALDLHDNPIDGEAAKLLAAAMLPKLRTLAIHVHQLADDAILTLARSRTLPHDLVRFWRGVAEQRKAVPDEP